jgi:dTDP-4-amino-4,6-dideoxygalactose transaminase
MLLSSDPKAGYLALQEDIDRCVLETLRSGWYILGPRVQAFEEAFAAYLGASGCVGVANGTDAVQLALRACGIKTGDRVATVSHTAVATVSAIDWIGAQPVLIDIDPATFTMDPEKLDATLQADPGHCIKAIVVVHLYGLSADVDSLRELAIRHGAALIEDCSQAHGATWQGRKVGTLGRCGTFSFYPTKNLGAFGDGGAVVSSDPDLLDRLKLLHQYGWRERYISEIAGYNSRIDELQAAILSVKLPYLDACNDRRRALAACYGTAFKDLPLVLPLEPEGRRHVYHQYVIRSDRRENLRRHLAASDIGTAILYPQPVHLQVGYRDRVVVGVGGLPETERASRDILCLPVYPEMSEEQGQQVVTEVQGFFE